MSEKRTNRQAPVGGDTRGVGQGFDHNEGGLRALAVWIALVSYRLMYFKCQANGWLGCHTGGQVPVKEGERR
jgi:hypothetical protein